MENIGYFMIACGSVLLWVVILYFIWIWTDKVFPLPVKKTAHFYVVRDDGYEKKCADHDDAQDCCHILNSIANPYGCAYRIEVRYEE